MLPFVFAVILALSLLEPASPQKLLLLQETFRHGARYPIYKHPEDGSDQVFRERSDGELTTEGKNMHYLLGKIIYEQYWDKLFGDTPYEEVYNQSHFYIKSTNVNRTIESAQSHMFGLFQKIPPLTLTSEDIDDSLPAWESHGARHEDTPGSVFDTGPAFHPTAIHVQHEGANELDSGDFLTTFSPKSCPNQAFWIEDNWNSAEAEEIKSRHEVKAAVQALSETVGRPVEIEQIYQWKDTKTSQEFLDEPYLPIFDHPVHQKYLDYIQVVTLYINLFYREEQIRAVATNYMRQTLENIQRRIDGSTGVRLVIYSAHDTTIGMVLAALNMSNVPCINDHYLKGIENSDTCVYKYPRYTANILFELWENGTDHYIKILYNGKPRKIPICGYKLQCSVEQFARWVRSFQVDDYNEACGIYESHQTYTAVIIVLVVVVLVMAAAIVRLRRKMKRQQLEREKSDKNE